MLELNVVFCNEGEILGDMPAELLSMSVLGEVVMVYEYFDWVFCPKQ